ncbi:MAG: DUF4349 domain-containing protein [Polyangiaceae bacterium]|nr:DUF4349 domain-containing protein [Polyangiaceae bacterium]
MVRSTDWFASFRWRALLLLITFGTCEACGLGVGYRPSASTPSGGHQFDDDPRPMSMPMPLPMPRSQLAAPALAAGPVARPTLAPSDNPSPEPKTPEPPSNTESKRKPLLIYEATLDLAVFEAKKGLDAVEKLALEVGGYLVNRTDSSILVRVPAARFEETLKKSSAFGDELHRNVKVRDVTLEFTDLSVRLDNLLQMRKRVTELLAQTKNVDEALRVEQELTRITSEIESLKGKLALLGELIQYSTLEVRFQPRPVERLNRTVQLPFPWLRNLGLTNLLRLE